MPLGSAFLWHMCLRALRAKPCGEVQDVRCPSRTHACGVRACACACLRAFGALPRSGCCAGLVMTPMSSLLEASNAGHMNPESTPPFSGVPQCFERARTRVCDCRVRGGVGAPILVHAWLGRHGHAVDTRLRLPVRARGERPSCPVPAAAPPAASSTVASTARTPALLSTVPYVAAPYRHSAFRCTGTARLAEWGLLI